VRGGQKPKIEDGTGRKIRACSDKHCTTTRHNQYPENQRKKNSVPEDQSQTILEDKISDQEMQLGLSSDSSSDFDKWFELLGVVEILYLDLIVVAFQKHVIIKLIYNKKMQFHAYN